MLKQPADQATLSLSGHHADDVNIGDAGLSLFPSGLSGAEQRDACSKISGFSVMCYSIMVDQKIKSGKKKKEKPKAFC